MMENQKCLRSETYCVLTVSVSLTVKSASSLAFIPAAPPNTNYKVTASVKPWYTTVYSEAAHCFSHSSLHQSRDVQNVNGILREEFKSEFLKHICVKGRDECGSSSRTCSVSVLLGNMKL